MRVRTTQRAGLHQAGSAGGVFIMVLLVIAVVVYGIWRFSPDWLPGPVRQQLPLSPLDPLPSAGPEHPRAATPATAAGRAAAPAPNPPLYKWKDANGVVNVTDKPPAGRDYETVLVNPDTNVVPSDVPPTEEDGPAPE